jgi:hypothetical protein
MTVRALYLLIKILATNYLKTIAIDELVGIEECALAAALLWV